MDLRSEILREHSKKHCDKIVSWVGNSQKRFNELFSLFISDQYRVVQRAAWPVGYCVNQHPVLIKKNWSKLVKTLKKENLHDAVKRNAVRLILGVDIPKKYQGEIMNLCFSYLESVNEAVAIMAFSLTVLGKLSDQYPEIIPEIKTSIASQFERQSPAFRSRAKKILKKFES